MLTQSHITRLLGFVPGFKRPGIGVGHLLSSSAEIVRKDRRVLIFTPLNVLAACWGWTLLLYFILLHIATELTPWKGLFIEKLIVPYLVKKFTMFYGNRNFITVFTKALF